MCSILITVSGGFIGELEKGPSIENEYLLIQYTLL